jgi:hypothetical protein
MKNYILIAVSCFVLCSCLMTSPIQVTTLQGKYQETPFTVTTEKSKDVIWEKVVDIFAVKSIPITLIDKSSGIVVSNKLNLSATYELLNGMPKDSTAALIFNNVYDSRFPSDGYLPFGGIYADFNVRVKEIDGKASINVNIQNVYYENTFTRHAGLIKIMYDVKSTGVFEKAFTDELLK